MRRKISRLAAPLELCGWIARVYTRGTADGLLAAVKAQI